MFAGRKLRQAGDGGEAVITDSLQTYFNAGNTACYPGTGTDVFDLSGNSNDGVLVNSVGWSSTGGGYFDFDGSNDYIDLVSNSIDPNADFTLTFWALRDTTGLCSLIGSHAPTIDHLQLRYNNANPASLSILRNGTADLGTFSGYTVGNGTLAEITIQRDIAPTNKFLLHVNGAYVSEFNSSSTFSNKTTPCLGASNTTSIPTEVLDGRIYSFLHYDRLLNSDEIEQNFEALRSQYGV